MSPARISTDVAEAAERIRQGKLVAFPTETVYGLGASAFSERAAADVFAFKKRPADNPLIVHLPDAGWLDRVAVDIPPDAVRLFRHFAPGPLTLVLKKHPDIPRVVSAGLETVAVRVPDHGMARDLIRLAGLPLVAPSANLSGTPSPTLAEHVLHDFAGEDLLILDGGPCTVGVESTVLDLTVDPPVILRPGIISAADIEAACGIVVGDTAASAEKPKSPGQKYRHYAPRARVIPVEHGAFAEALSCLSQTDPSRIGVFADEATIRMLGSLLEPDSGNMSTFAYGPAADSAAAGRALYAALRRFDAEDVTHILAPVFPETGEALAYNDRLARASTEVKRVLFVCTGNTCRSPMAEALFSQAGLPGWLASSAGLFAREGEPAAANAVAVMKERGLDLSRHRATHVTPLLLRTQSIIVPVSRSHAAMLAELYPDSPTPACPLSDFTDDESDVGDPFGGDLAQYEKTARILETAVRRLIEHIQGGGIAGT